ncbi:cell wall hydrolase [Paenibacillus harenae]|uniref:Spore germination cell wall hydrolase CwlJ-like protein n=1 Tax=Paenibacillus harenae TaxID=306543 RepID=A0ABT9U6H7_PAEHA|nr:cell wall hydrolase [Paenibacillus harenae]MDQ0114852.1 spore germination cell wall hydrolase CwlJ-like protein [Paenibacillus harenae]
MVREGKPTNRLTLVMVLTMLLLCIGPLSVVSAQAGAVVEGVTIKLDGEIMKMTDPVRTQDGRIYVPVSRIAGLLGASVSWDKNSEEATIHTVLKEKIVFGIDVPVVYFNGGRYLMDAAPFMAEGRIYVPLRHAAELMHAKVNWNAEDGILDLVTVQPAITTEEYGIDEISKEIGGTNAELLKRNGLDAKAALQAGTKLKVVVPSVLDTPAKPYTEADLMLLAKITMVEAGYEPYEGQLGIANIILNRVKDSRFPDTIKGVIYSGKQFPPAHNGLLDKSKPNASSLRAAKDALNGKNNIKNAVYFFNPKVSKGEFWSSLDVVVTIAHHSFAK